MHKISNIITDTYIYIYISDKNISYQNYKNGIINHFLKNNLGYCLSKFTDIQELGHAAN